MDYAIKIENVSKLYRLGGSKAPDNFREALANLFKRNQKNENDRDFFALKDVNISRAGESTWTYRFKRSWEKHPLENSIWNYETYEW